MLASVATAEARIAGANLFSRTHYNKGTISVFSTMINGRAFAAAGISERQAKAAGCEIIVGRASAPDTHPAGMPGSSPIDLKLIFAKDTRVLLGGGLSGGKSTGEKVNVISACILHRMTVDDIVTFQMGTHPALTPSPIVYPLVNAACQCVTPLKGT
jgi:pyruvate/2-oxoglutarate dehydrogenase complex dihydrolipoamide dehydrogenase (E3) component